MLRNDAACGLDLHDDSRLDHHVRTVTSDALTVKHDFERNLMIDPEPCVPHQYR